MLLTFIKSLFFTFEYNSEGCTVFLVGFDGYLCSYHIALLFGEGETESVTTDLALFIRAIESLENVGELVGLDMFALIIDSKIHFFGRLIKSNTDLSVFVAVLYRVVKKYLKHL